ncbi:kinase [Thraustotheca clavata]|uniref:Kinase n=1 Tax=Thraustotheca clavata TaxID=74557 RepID=A0A1V9Y7Q7_9STRA|nr:kinase [Thraustotheca clavata]
MRRLDGSSSGGGSSALNIALGTITGVIVLVIIILYCHQQRKSRQRREARRIRRQQQNQAKAGDGYMDAENNRTINFNMMGQAKSEGEDIYIMRGSEENDADYYNKPKPKKLIPKQAPFKMDQDLLDHKVDYSMIQYTRKLSKGAFGEVWLGQYQGRYVAIKQILEERKTDSKEIECFVAEIKLMANFQHPNIVDFLGFSWNPKDANLCALTEYMKNGDLQALVYLHSLTPKVIHRDLKSKNVLLDEKCTAKLSDFGISRLRQLEETMTAGVGTALWAAPEVFLAKKYNDRADVYSLGVVLSELDTCAIPYADQAVRVFVHIGKNGKLDGMAVIKLVTQQKAKPTFSPSCPDAVRDLAFRCLDYEPDNRPSSAEVVALIKEHSVVMTSLRRLDGGSSSTLNIILGVAAGVLLLLIIGWFIWHRRNREARREERYYGAQPSTQPPQLMNVPANDDDHRTYNFHEEGKANPYVVDSEESTGDYKRVNNKKGRDTPPFQMDQEMLDAKVDFHLIQYTRKLTKGAFGEVWLGQFKGRYVAIKQILEERKTDKKEIECFVAEIKLMLNLKHPNILDFLGFSWNPRDGNLCFLTAYMKNGDLFYHLQKRKATLTWPTEKVQIALDIAQGLVYLHSLTPKIIHRDLKSKNILLDTDWTAKINDFGISRLAKMAN